METGLICGERMEGVEGSGVVLNSAVAGAECDSVGAVEGVAVVVLVVVVVVMEEEVEEEVVVVVVVGGMRGAGEEVVEEGTEEAGG